MLIDASKIQRNPTATHRKGEYGTKNNAIELKMAPMRKTVFAFQVCYAKFYHLNNLRLVE